MIQLPGVNLPLGVLFDKNIIISNETFLAEQLILMIAKHAPNTYVLWFNLTFGWNFLKPVYFFQTSLFFSNQLIFFEPVCFFQTRNIILNQLIYQLSEKGFLSFGVRFKNRGMAFWGVWKQNITGKLISSSSLISIHVYFIHTPSTTTASPCLQILLTIFLLTFLPEFEPLSLIYRLITIPELSPLSYKSHS